MPTDNTRLAKTPDNDAKGSRLRSSRVLAFVLWCIAVLAMATVGILSLNSPPPAGRLRVELPDKTHAEVVEVYSSTSAVPAEIRIGTRLEHLAMKLPKQVRTYLGIRTPTYMNLGTDPRLLAILVRHPIESALDLHAALEDDAGWMTYEAVSPLTTHGNWRYTLYRVEGFAPHTARELHVSLLPIHKTKGRLPWCEPFKIKNPLYAAPRAATTVAEQTTATLDGKLVTLETLVHGVREWRNKPASGWYTETTTAAEFMTAKNTANTFNMASAALLHIDEDDATSPTYVAQYVSASTFAGQQVANHWGVQTLLLP